MSFQAMDGERRQTADAILEKFGAAIDEAEQRVAAKTLDPQTKKLMAARIALEYAVLATAREKNLRTEAVASALQHASAAQQAVMIRQGAAALGRAYGVEPEVLANAFAGRMVSVDLPKDLASTPEVEQMVDTCRGLVASVVKDEYARRGWQATAGPDSFIAPRSGAEARPPARSELAARLAFMDATIDGAVERGALGKGAASQLKERIEAQIFEPRPAQALRFSDRFRQFFEQRGKAIRIEAMTEVRGVTQSRTVQEIAAKLRETLPAVGLKRCRTDERAHKPMER